MTSEALPIRRIVVGASGLIYWGGVLIQGRRIRKRIGRSPNLRPHGTKEKALWLGWFMVILVWIGQPWLVGGMATTSGLSLLPSLLRPATLAAGLGLVLLGYAGTIWSYAAMGDTWRIGIDACEKNALVSRGPYRWVRHPIYLLQMVMLAGAALLLPTPISFLALAAHSFCVHLKASDEEKYQKTVHSLAYCDYIHRTGKFLPRLKRRRSAEGKDVQPQTEYVQNARSNRPTTL